MKQPYKGQSAAQRLTTISAAKAALRRAGALLLLGVGTVLNAQAQQPASPFFSADAEARAAAVGTPLQAALFHSQALTLDVAGLRAALATATAENQPGAAPLVLALPLPNGGTARFAIHEAPVMAPALAARFPQVKTYAGFGLDDETASVRLDLAPQGFHAQVLAGNGQSFLIDPLTRTDTRHYLAFYKKDMNRAAAGPAMTCGFEPTAAETKASAQRVASASAAVASPLASGSQLRTYRLAVAATGEYTTFHGGTVALAQAAIVTTVNRVVGVYEKELAVRLILVANNSSLIYTDPRTDPYANTSGDLTANQNNVNAVIGTANYDIGHLVGTGGGGVAGLGVVCGTRKAQGLTGSSSPVGDSFDIDYVAHEMGHQFSGNHPFNGNAGSCAGGNRNASTAWEPGSGSTIMAYAGICGSANDLQPNSDATFHTGNYQEMRAFIESTTCGTSQPTGNTAPAVTAPASGKTLPIGTPFKLTAAATDAENDPLTYLWEELDLGPTGTPTAAQVANQNIPLFRSFVPSLNATRYFPRLSDLVNNTTVIGERLPTVTRTMKFRCTARDQHSGPAGVIGGVDYSALVNLNVTSTAGPFVISAPNTAMSWTGGTPQTVTWNVAGTDVAPVSCATVNLRLSLDGGLTYPVLLASGAANNGTASVTVPNVATSQARVMVESADNYFFDISDANFTIAPGPGPAITSFTPANGPVGTVVTITGTNFTGATGVSFNGVAAVFTVTSATTITATVAVGTTSGNISVTTPAGTAVSAMPFLVGSPPTIASFTPASGPVGTTVVITGTNLTAVTQVLFNGVNAPVFSINSATTITVTVPKGASTGLISVVSPFGTGVSATAFTIPPLPIITSFTPTSGPAGTVVVITGSNFTGATQVTFNGTVAPVFTVNSPNQITVTVPAGISTGLLTVTTPNGIGVSTIRFVVPIPNDLCANAIPLACGQTLTGSTLGASAAGDPTGSCSGTSVDAGGVFYSITGTGAAITLSTCNSTTSFDSKLFVYSGSCGAYVCVASNDDQSSTVTCSALTFNSVAGTNYLIFVSGYQTAAGNFGLTATCATPPPVPVITSLTPNSGPIATGIVIMGSNFTGATNVTFNGVAATYTVIDAANIVATVPNGATTGNVVVRNGGSTSNGLLFTVTNPTPVITSLSPISGPAGTLVTVVGSGLGGATTVTLNGVAVTGFTVVNANTITFAIPAGGSTGNIVVTTGGGVSNGLPFTVTVVSATAKANQTEFSIWPNPVAAKGTLHVTLVASATAARLTLHNVLGQVISTRTFSGTTTEVSTAGLAAGTYLLTVQTDLRAPSIQRVVVE